MTLSRGAWVKQNGTIGLTAVELRRVDAACYYQTAPGTVRSGVLWVHSASFALVAGAANMSYDLQPVPGLVIGRAANEGAYTLTTQGVTNIATGAAPAAGLSRYDLIWIKQNDTEKADADNQPVLGVTQGTAAASPTKPTASVPVGAYVLAEARVYSGTTATNAGPNTITQVWQYTALVGEPVPVRSDAERPATPRPGDQVRRLDMASPTAREVWNGTKWFVVGRRVAQFTGVPGGAGAVTGAGNVSWGYGVFTKVAAAAGADDSFATPSATASKISLLEPGTYAVLMKGTATTNPGIYTVSIKKADDTYVYADGNNGNGLVWGATTSAPDLLFPAPTDLLFGLTTQNSISAPVTITIMKVSD